MLQGQDKTAPVIQDENIVQNDVTENTLENEVATLFDEDSGLPPMPTPLAGDQPNIEDNPELTPLPEFENIELETLPALDQEQVSAASLPETSSSVPVAKNDLATTQIISTVDTERLDALNQKIIRMEQMMVNIEDRLSDMDRALQTREKNIEPSKKISSTPATPAPITEAPKPKPTPKKVVAKPKPVKKKIVPKTVWRLRSAQPGKAIVSPKGRDDTRSITVGSSLSGIGRVQSISNSSGKWVVTGTKGSISQ